MHSARLPLLRQCLDDGNSVGEMKRIACNFSFLGDDAFAQKNIRVDSQLEPFGCLGDLGWYCIRFLLWANRWQSPTHVTGRCLTGMRGEKSADRGSCRVFRRACFPRWFQRQLLLFFFDGESAVGSH